MICYCYPCVARLVLGVCFFIYFFINDLALGKGLKIVRYQDLTKKRNQSQKRKEKKRNEGRVNKKRRVEGRGC